MKINVIGAGLAGCEAAMQIASAGIPVRLYEMKPNKKSPAHKTNYFGELVCSNSLKAMRVESAAGLLKEEMRRLNSFLMQCSDKCRVPAGGALAVDREKFAQLVTEGIQSQPLIEVVSEEITAIPESGITVIATGPLTSDALAKAIEERFGDSLSFFDAAAPIVTAESVNMEYAFTASRYERGGEDDYINCPMNKEEYERFYNALVSAERAPLHDFDVSNPKVYEGCMPVEVMAQRGEGTLRFGPMKPVGLIDPKTGHRPWAVLQLRKENAAGTMYNLVGFQTNLKFPEQKRVFSLIPALHNADFVRYGVMHRNTFLCSPKILNADFSVKENKNLFFAGQITGVEGY
ncbi:MAG: methylenetetrahydrofolate--tRNA-(uracil(54)-C(5))-methyltransferase (FADH(2)-oxidizing) TrmFO, partial [Ruminococcus sp.]